MKNRATIIIAFIMTVIVTTVMVLPESTYAATKITGFKVTENRASLLYAWAKVKWDKYGKANAYTVQLKKGKKGKITTGYVTGKKPKASFDGLSFDTKPELFTRIQ